jgi:hypothetical protein
MATPASIAAAISAIDRAHAADPTVVRGVPREITYAERIGTWISALVPSPSDALILAARAQHLERWAIPRAQYPMDRAGYHRWRRAVQLRQGERAGAIAAESGVDAATAARFAALVSKSAPARDPEAQALEDAACLVFLAHELEAFAAEHADYAKERMLGILRKSWAKMSAQARALAATIQLPPALAPLVREAIGEPGGAAGADED